MAAGWFIRSAAVRFLSPIIGGLLVRGQNWIADKASAAYGLVMRATVGLFNKFGGLFGYGGTPTAGTPAGATGQTTQATGRGTTLHGEPVKLLRDFFGTGLKGAQDREACFKIPAGLTREILLEYRRVAVRVIEAGKDGAGVQAARLKLIDRALSEMPK